MQEERLAAGDDASLASPPSNCGSRISSACTTSLDAVRTCGFRAKWREPIKTIPTRKSEEVNPMVRQNQPPPRRAHREPLKPLHHLPKASSSASSSTRRQHSGGAPAGAAQVPPPRRQQARGKAWRTPRGRLLVGWRASGLLPALTTLRLGRQKAPASWCTVRERKHQGGVTILRRAGSMCESAKTRLLQEIGSECRLPHGSRT